MDISYILSNYDTYEQMLKNRFRNTDILVEIKTTHTLYVNILFQCQQLRTLKNKINDAIRHNKFQNISMDTVDESNLLTFLNVDLSVYSKNDLCLLSKSINNVLTEKDKLTADYFIKRNELVHKIPNLLHKGVPIFDDEKDNKVICIYDSPTKILDSKYNQYELSVKLGIYELANDISGSRSYFLCGDGVRLNTALINYAVDFISEKGYRMMQTPHFMTKESMKDICQLSDYNETLYNVDDEHYLIATSEQPLTAYFRHKKVVDMPIKLAGLSSCYRKEAGAHGKDTNGIFRVHQFEKVEQFCVTDAATSFDMMENMINISKEFYESLGISYRVVNIVSGDLNDAASMKYDLEGWFAGSGKYRELVSCTNTTDFFSRRLYTKDDKGNLVHMLNSTLCANTRTLCCIMETYQTDDGINIPSVLQKYFGKDKIKFVQ